MIRNVLGTVSNLQRVSLQVLAGWRRQPIGLLACALLFAASVTLFFLYRERVKVYESIITRTLGTETENTPQSYKGLEAFILSNVHDGIHTDLQEAHLSRYFLDKYSSVETALQNASNNIAAGDKEVTLQFATDEHVGVDKVTYNDPDLRYPGYLFLPAYLVHNSTIVQNNGVQIKDPAIVQSVVVGRSVAQSLQQLTDIPVISLSGAAADVESYLQLAPAQVYLITLDGATRVFNRRADHPFAEYSNQFPPTTFFPSRPYFWPTLTDRSSFKGNSKQEGDIKIGDFFRVSKPYLDLGGSGVVITLTRPIQVKETWAVLCIDIQLDSAAQRNIYADLERNIRSIGGTTAIQTCTIDAGNSSSIPRNCPSQLVEVLQDRKNWSKVSGNLYIFKTPPAESRLRFSIPINQEFSGTEHRVRFMLVDVDLKTYREVTSLYALIAATCFGCMTVLLAYMLGSSVMRGREFESALERVADVMIFSPTPYIRLDVNDRIRDASASFRALLGIPVNPEEMNSLKERTLRSFCADAVSEDEYDKVLQLRRQGLPVSPYVLELRRPDKSTVRVRVHSAALPGAGANGMPVTFGILVEQIAR